MARTGFISLVVEQNLKDGLNQLRKNGQTLTWHLERAIRNYLISKKVKIKS